MVTKRGRSSLNASIMASLQKMQVPGQEGVAEPESLSNPTRVRVITIEDTYELTLPKTVTEDSGNAEESITDNRTDVFKPMLFSFDRELTDGEFPILVNESGELVAFEFIFNGNQYKADKIGITLNLEDITNNVLNISYQQWSEKAVRELHRHLELYWLQFNLVLVYQHKLWMNAKAVESARIHLDDYYGVTVIY